jgi:hypothetical protein
MRKEKFSDYMKIMSLILLFMCFVQNVSAPTKDFPIRLSMLRNAMKFAEARCHELEFERFVNDLGRRESGNNWLCINRYGFFGEWQFAESTVHYLGYKQVTLKKFKSDPEIFPPELQRKALESLIKVNMFLLKDYQGYIGQTINGVTITRSGMIAAAHLGGYVSVKKYLSTGGRLDRKDGFGTAVSNYMKKFGGYEID